MYGLFSLCHFFLLEATYLRIIWCIMCVATAIKTYRHFVQEQDLNEQRIVLRDKVDSQVVWYSRKYVCVRRLLATLKGQEV